MDEDKNIQKTVRQFYKKKTFKLNMFYEGRDSVVGIAITLRSGNRIPVEESFLVPSRPTVGLAQLSVQRLPSIIPGGSAVWGLSWSFIPSSAEVKE